MAEPERCYHCGGRAGRLKCVHGPVCQKCDRVAREFPDHPPALNDGPGSPQWERECEEFGCLDDGQGP